MSELVAGIIVLTVFLLINAVIAWFAHKAMKRFPWLLGWLGAVYALFIVTPAVKGALGLSADIGIAELIGVILALVILGRAAVLAERLRERGGAALAAGATLPAPRAAEGPPRPR